MVKPSPHNEAVAEFLAKAKQENPEKFAEVCERYPVLTGRQWRRINEREVTKGLNPLGEDNYEQEE